MGVREGEVMLYYVLIKPHVEYLSMVFRWFILINIILKGMFCFTRDNGKLKNIQRRTIWEGVSANYFMWGWGNWSVINLEIKGDWAPNSALKQVTVCHVNKLLDPIL